MVIEKQQTPTTKYSYIPYFLFTNEWTVWSIHPDL